jgi:hypothetical protein
MAVFWVVVPFGLEEVYQRFRGTCCLHHQGYEGARTSEKLANFYQITWRYNPEDIHIHTFHHENLKFCIGSFLNNFLGNSVPKIGENAVDIQEPG